MMVDGLPIMKMGNADGFSFSEKEREEFSRRRQTRSFAQERDLEEDRGRMKKRSSRKRERGKEKSDSQKKGESRRAGGLTLS